MIYLSGIKHVKVVKLTAEHETRKSKSAAEKAARKRRKQEAVQKLRNPLLLLAGFLGVASLAAAVITANALRQPSHPVVIGLIIATVVFCGFVATVLTRKGQRSGRLLTSK